MYIIFELVDVYLFGSFCDFNQLIYEAADLCTERTGLQPQSNDSLQLLLKWKKPGLEN